MADKQHMGGRRTVKPYVLRKKCLDKSWSKEKKNLCLFEQLRKVDRYTQLHALSSVTY